MFRLRSLLPLAAVVALIAPATASAYFPDTVLPGESLTSVAAADGLTIGQLAAANGLAPDAQLIAGSVLMIPPQGSVASLVTPQPGPAPGAGVSAPLSSAGDYVVHWGDTLSAIAARAGTTVSELAAANGLDPNGILYAGSVLRVSGLPSVSQAVPVSTASAATQPVGAAAEGSSGSPPYPTPQRVTASQIDSIAAANGVPASLADAVAWQESGFNNDLVSSADARGVMQILPGTWDWIQRSLTAGEPLAPASALDNVRGGVLLLHSLLNSTGGNPALAAAGYYQGLPSVQRNGLFKDTQNYVNDVMALSHQFGGG